MCFSPHDNGELVLQALQGLPRPPVGTARPWGVAICNAGTWSEDTQNNARPSQVGNSATPAEGRADRSA